MLALPYAWTKVNLQVRALLREPLQAHTGLGKPARGAEAFVRLLVSFWGLSF